MNLKHKPKDKRKDNGGARPNAGRPKQPPTVNFQMMEDKALIHYLILLYGNKGLKNEVHKLLIELAL